MNTDKNPRADSKLKRLPDAVQAEMARRMATPGVTQQEVIAWLREDGVDTSPRALSEWLPWYHARLRRMEREQRVLAFLEEEKRSDPNLTDEVLFQRGQRMFSEMALADEDARSWYLTHKLALERADQALKESKYRDQVAEQKRKIEGALTTAKSKGGLTPETLKQIEEAASLL